MSLSTKHRRRVVRNSPRQKSRRGVVLAIVLACMVLLLLMLGGLARRVVLEHRAIDSRAQSHQADWLLWSAKHRAELQLQSGADSPTNWEFAPQDAADGKQIVAIVVEKQTNGPTSQDTARRNLQLELHWTTASNQIVERLGSLRVPANRSKEPSK